MKKHEKIVWLYEKNHLKQPFICIALESLGKEGHEVFVIDMMNGKSKETPYNHIALLKKQCFHIRLFAGNYDFNKPGRSVPLLLAYALKVKPSIVIASMPSALLAGWIAARLLRARLVYYPLELYGEQSEKSSGLFKKVERQILKGRVDAVITQNEERAKIYMNERGVRIPPVVVHNYKCRSKVKRTGWLRERLQLSPQNRMVLYEGYLMGGRWLEKLIQAAPYLPDDVRLVLMGEIKQEWWKEHIENIIKSPEISKKILVAPYVKHEKIIKYVADADVGIITYDDKCRNNYYCEPGKLSDYVQAGLPVVAPDFPTIGTVIKNYGIGATFTTPDPREIARAINMVLSMPKEKWIPGLAKARKDMVWETQLPNFLKAVTGQ